MMPATNPILPIFVRRVGLQSLLVLVAAASPVSGQTDLPEQSRSVVLTELVLPATADPTGSRPAIEPRPSATIEAGVGGVVGKFTYGFKQGDNNFINVTLTAPAKEGRTLLVLGDELPSGTKVTVAFSRLIGLRTRLASTALPVAQRLLKMASVRTREQSVTARADVLAAAADANVLTTGPGLLITGSWDYGREKFRYRESASGPDLEPQLRESTGGAVVVGLLFRPDGSTSASYVGVGFRAGRSWKGAAPKSRCTPIEGSQVLDCAPVVIGQPTEQKKRSINVEYRQHIGTAIGWTPLFAYDFEAAQGQRALFEVPVYLVTDGATTPQLTGGVAFGWRQGTGAYAAVFVGPKFSVPGI